MGDKKSHWSGERLETFIFSRDAIEHLHRYAIVKNYVKDKIVLDIACGEGYGSALLCENAKQVYGVDIDEKSVDLASKKYIKKNLSYLVGDVTEISFDDNSIDIIVSFETIEHHNKHDEMMLEFKRVLKPDGILFLSTPDKFHYTDEANFKNKYHIKELYKEEFLKLVNNYFSKNQFLAQKYLGSISVIEEDNINNKVNLYSGNYNAIEQKKVSALYLIAIASDNDFTLQNSSIFEGSKIIEKKIINDIYNSNSFKLGSFLLYPIKKIKSIIK